MKIAIEAQRIFRKDKHGMDFVVLEFVRRLEKLGGTDEFYILVGPGEDECLAESERVHIVRINAGSYPVWEQIALPLALMKIKPDLLHCTSNTAPLFCSVPLVLTLHDIIFLERQQGSNASLYQKLGRIYRRLMVPPVLKKCKTIITVSDFERKRILSSLNLPQDRVVSVYNGFSPAFRQMEARECEAVRQKYITQDGFIFFLGNTDPKKNTVNTFKAYSLYLKESKIRRPLLVADYSPARAKASAEEARCPEILSNMILPGYIPNTDLPYIYNSAFAFLYTSLRESFGIPLLESMACGTAVVSSNTSAIPEVAGSGALLVDPTEPRLIADALLSLERDAELLQKTRAYGLERVKNFSWENTARGVVDIYHEIGKE